MKGIIIGGGIGGLTTSIALTQRGIDNIVFEQAPEFEPIGAGIWMATNALNILNRLGVAEEIINAGNYLDQVAIMDTNGAMLSCTDLNPIKEKFGFGSVAIHRGVLQKILLSHVDANKIIKGKKFVRFSQDEQKLKVDFENGTTDTCDFLILADGIKSKGREQIFPCVPLRYSNQTCWRFVTDFSLPHTEKKNAVEIWASEKGLRVGYSHISDKQVYCYITTCSPANGKDNPYTVKKDLLKMCSSFDNTVIALIQSADAGKILRNDIWDFKPIKKWYINNVTLLGDAAHATTPNLGQGACQAIEDAFVIAKTLSEIKNPILAFEKYQTIRKSKADHIVNFSWQLGLLVNLPRFPKALVKLMMRFTPKKISRQQLEKVFSLNF